MATSLAFPPSGDAAGARPHYSMGLRERYRLDKTRATLLQQAQTAPDIGYTPILSKYHDRTSARIRAGNLENEVPSGWPKYLRSPLAWTGADFNNEDSYVHYLSGEEKADIDNALDHFNGRGRDLAAALYN